MWSQLRETCGAPHANIVWACLRRETPAATRCIVTGKASRASRRVRRWQRTLITVQIKEPIPQPAPFRLTDWFGRRANALIGLLVFGIALAVAQYVVQLEARNRAARERVAMLSFASRVSSHVSREIGGALMLTAGLKSYLVVRHSNLRRAEVDAILKELANATPFIRNLSLAIGYRIAYVYPFLGNEKAVGLDYRTLRKQWPAVMKAAQTGEPVLVGPLELVQGGLGLIYRAPVFVEGRYWGMLSTVFDAPTLLRHVFSHLAEDRFDFAVRRVAESAPRDSDAIWGQQSLFERQNAVAYNITLPGGRWEFVIQPKIAAGAGRELLVLQALSVLIAALLGWTTYLALLRRALLRQVALHDPLTGLANRRLLEDRLTRALQRQARTEGAIGVILFIDLDRFKETNDEHGHRAGDAVLQGLAKRISGALRETDTVGRWGGDELLVVVENTDRAKVAELTERVRQIVEMPVQYQKLMLKVGASIGRVVFPDDGTSAAELLRLADQRMYEDKRQRKVG